MATYPVQGQSFNSGPVWDQMKFGSTGTNPVPLAGSYGGFFDRFRQFQSSIPEGLSPDDRMLYSMFGMNALNADVAREQARETTREMLNYQRQAAQEANEMGIRNTVIGSLLKDVPAAIGNAFAQRQRYAPEQIEIAARGSSQTPRYAGMRNYYGFVG